MITGGLHFVKGHGTRNDFILLPDREGTLALETPTVRALCDRRAGLGADGVIRVAPTAAVEDLADLAGEAAWAMDYRNADGGAVEMCGNGIRVMARFLADAGWARADEPLAIATRDGVKTVWYADRGRVTVDMGRPGLDGRPSGVPAEAEFVSMGNPHAVIFRDGSLDDAPVTADGPAIEAAVVGGTNVEWVVPTPDGLALRVWERGVGETMSCGTGACAVAVAATMTGRAGRRSVVDLPGGRLEVRWDDDDRVFLTGPAVLVASGTVDPQRLEAG